MKVTYKHAELKFVEVELTAYDIARYVKDDKGSLRVPRDFQLERMEHDDDTGNVLLVFRRQTEPQESSESENEQ